MALKHYSTIIFLVSLFFLGATQVLAQDTSNNSTSFFSENLDSLFPTKLKLSELERTPTTHSGILSSEEADSSVLSSNFLPLIDLEVGSVITVTLSSEVIDTRMILIRENNNGAEVILDTRGYLDDGIKAQISFLVEEGASYVIGATGYDVGAYAIDVSRGVIISKEFESFEAYKAEPYSIDSRFYLTVGRSFSSGIVNSLANYYKLPVFAGGEEITVSMKSERFNPSIFLINATTGKYITKTSFSGVSNIIFVAEADTEYLVKATLSGGNNTSGAYELSLSDFFVEDVANISLSATELNVSESNSVTLSDTLGPEIAPDQSSVFYALSDLVVDSIVTVTLDSTDFDTYMFLIRENGDDSGAEVILDTIRKPTSGDSNASQISFLVEEGASYVMEATSFQNAHSGNYSITTTTGDVISEAFESFETYSTERFQGDKYVNADFVDLAQGSSAEGQLEKAPDRFINEEEYLANYYKLPTFVDGEEITISTESTDFDTYIYLIDATNEKYVAENDDFGDEYQMSSITFVVEADTEYLVKVTTAYEYGWGAYELIASIE